MRKILLGLFLAVAAGAAAQNQNRIAFTAGFHGSSVKPMWNPSPLALDSFNSTTSRTGIHLGFQATLPLGKKSLFRFQPGIQYWAKGATQSQVLDTAQTRLQRFTDEQFTNYIEIPLNLALALPLGEKTRFIVGAGPQVSLFYNGKISQTSSDTTGKFTFSDLSDLPVGSGEGQHRVAHLTVNALAGFEFGRVFLTANWSQGVTPYLTQNNQDFKHSTMGATLGIYLGRQQDDKQQKPAKDTDKDGVPDSEDACPTEPGSALTNGCPDRDGDGIADNVDACPGRKGPAENRGCPWPDSDGDGVLDKDDKCPNVAGSAKYGGCPIPDTDKDGLNDEEDKCPQEAGPKENGGCPVPEPKQPEVKKEVVEKVNTAARKIAFEHAKAALMPASLPVLDEVAALMQQHPELKISVEGHTSNAGNAAANQVLSEQRAKAVKAYLETKGVAAERITATGYGPTRPINNGKSEAEQAENRRVELKLSH